MAKKKALKADKAMNGDTALEELRAFGLNYPGAHYKSPWPGHMDLAVKDKTFAYLSLEGEPFGISCKLPASSEVALMLPFCTPTGYGLGKSGWVTAKFAAKDKIPVAMFKDWIDESYRAQAPKGLVKSIIPLEYRTGRLSSRRYSTAAPAVAKRTTTGTRKKR